MLVITITNNTSLRKFFELGCPEPFLNVRYCAGFWGHKCQQGRLFSPRKGAESLVEKNAPPSSKPGPAAVSQRIFCRGNCPVGRAPKRPLSMNTWLPVVPPSLLVPVSEREKGRALGDWHNHRSFFPSTQPQTLNFQSPGGPKQGPVLAPD